jgi:hypothetical protein
VPPIEFVMSSPHSAEKDVVYDHAKHAVWFPTGRPTSDAALGAELSRLACIRLETSFGFEQDRIRKVLARVGFTDCQFFENSVDSDGRVLIASLRRSNRTTVAPQSWFSSHFAAVIRMILLIWLTISALGPSPGNRRRAKSTRGFVAA